MYIRLKTKIEDYMNKQIDIYNEIDSLKHDIEEENIEYEDILERLNSLNFGAIGVEEEVIAGYLKDIAERAIELKDEKLLTLLEGIGVVSADSWCWYWFNGRK